MSTRQEARAEAAAEKARRKALRPWYRKKRFLIPLALAVIVIIAVAAGGGDDAGENVSTAARGAAEEASTPQTVDPSRPDAQKEDQEVPIGQSVRISGYTATVTKAGFQQEISQFEDEGYMVVDVTIANRDDKAQPYNTFHWKLQTPNGQVVDPAIVGNQLGAGDLVAGGNVTGKVIFEVGSSKGDFFVIYKPDAFDAARGIWKVTI